MALYFSNVLNHVVLLMMLSSIEFENIGEYKSKTKTMLCLNIINVRELLRLCIRISFNGKGNMVIVLFRNLTEYLNNVGILSGTKILLIV